MLSTLCLLAALSQASPIAEVPFRVTDEAIIVDATVNGKTVSAMFDTGFAGAIVLNDAIDVGPPSGNILLRDFVGEIEVPTVKLKSLVFGGQSVDVSGLEIVQQPLARLSQVYHAHTDGILGFSVIKNFVAEIDFEHHRFLLHPKSFDITTRMPDNRRTFLARMLPMGQSSIELEARTRDGKPMALSLDTGNAFYATTHKDSLERVGLWPDGWKPHYPRYSSIASGPVESYAVRLKQMSVWGVPVAESVWDVIDLPSSSAEGAGTVGFQFLKNFNLVIDYERRAVWLDNFTGKVADDPPGEAGLDAGYSKRTKRIEVAHVQYYGWAFANREHLLPTREQLDRSLNVLRLAEERLRGRI
ncbi:MAG: hypothetical protein HY248_05490, partial [Fimbriimonas ginsengisoli]|nr:hypothetical protein [Fimbriimonas ginsengisoli]